MFSIKWGTNIYFFYSADVIGPSPSPNFKSNLQRVIEDVKITNKMLPSRGRFMIKPERHPGHTYLELINHLKFK